MALTDKVDRLVDDVATENIGFAPILQYYFEKAAIAKIIDDLVPIDPRRKVLTHGQAAVAMITAILFQVMQLYRLCPFARQSTVLDTILTGIAPEAYFERSVGRQPRCPVSLRAGQPGTADHRPHDRGLADSNRRVPQR